MNNLSEQFDVVVIGGGPAGIMTAGRSAELGAKTALLEKNNFLGRKLLITGKGRCNITNAEFDDRKFIEKIGKNGKFLFSSLALFGPNSVIDFFQKLGVKIKIERGNKVFPVSNKAEDILRGLKKYLNRSGVIVRCRQEVLKVSWQKDKKWKILFKDLNTGENRKTLLAKKIILCTGGKSYPLTGSTGIGYNWARSLGHSVIAPRPALVPVAVKEDWIKKLQGLSLKNVSVNVFQNNKKQDSRFGEMLFAHFGLTGPIILELSKKIGQLLKDGTVILKIDLKPALDQDQLDKRLQRDFEKSRDKIFKNYLSELVPQKLIAVILEFSKIDPTKKLNLISRMERKNLGVLLKSLPLEVDGLLGFDQAIITSGGINLKEVDSKTMESKIVKNLFFAGEILDLDGPTGGYNLQISWSTGYSAGNYAVENLKLEI